MEGGNWEIRTKRFEGYSLVVKPSKLAQKEKCPRNDFASEEEREREIG
jgi:hypothetical protein